MIMIVIAVSVVIIKLFIAFFCCLSPDVRFSSLVQLLLVWLFLFWPSLVCILVGVGNVVVSVVRNELSGNLKLVQFRSSFCGSMFA